MENRVHVSWKDASEHKGVYVSPIAMHDNFNREVTAAICIDEESGAFHLVPLEGLHCDYIYNPAEPDEDE